MCAMCIETYCLLLWKPLNSFSNISAAHLKLTLCCTQIHSELLSNPPQFHKNIDYSSISMSRTNWPVRNSCSPANNLINANINMTVHCIIVQCYKKSLVFQNHHFVLQEPYTSLLLCNMAGNVHFFFCPHCVILFSNLSRNLCICIVAPMLMALSQ